MIGNYHRVVFAALRGGSGKTTICLGLLAALRKQGRPIVPFKKGPDFIDAGWLAYAAGRPCYNLDSFLVGTGRVNSSFFEHADPNGLAIIEGNRGLFDGLDAQGTHSTAELAKLLKSPVVLVIDCTKSTRTVAAMVLGCLTFDPDLQIGGIILNNIGTARHEKLVRRTIAEYCGIPVVGALPRIRDNSLPERHMGLVPPLEHPGADVSISAAADIVNRFVDLEQIRTLAATSCSLDIPPQRVRPSRTVVSETPKIGYIHDSSFWFYYPENLEDLTHAGAELVEINSLRDNKLQEIDALYIGGGFPETHASQLAENREFRKSLSDSIRSGLPVYAECGGLMFLGSSLLLNDSEYPMVGAFPVSFTIEKRPQGHGYTVLEVDGDNPYYDKGNVLFGHEFHYSRPVRLHAGQVRTVFKNTRGTGFRGKRDGLCTLNTLAAYSHVHSSGKAGWAKTMYKQALAYRFVRKKSFDGGKMSEAMDKKVSIVEDAFFGKTMESNTYVG